MLLQTTKSIVLVSKITKKIYYTQLRTNGSLAKTNQDVSQQIPKSIQDSMKNVNEIFWLQYWLKRNGLSDRDKKLINAIPIQVKSKSI